MICCDKCKKAVGHKYQSVYFYENSKNDKSERFRFDLCEDCSSIVFDTISNGIHTADISEHKELMFEIINQKEIPIQAKTIGSCFLGEDAVCECFTTGFIEGDGGHGGKDFVYIDFSDIASHGFFNIVQRFPNKVEISTRGGLEHTVLVDVFGWIYHTLKGESYLTEEDKL